MAWLQFYSTERLWWTTVAALILMFAATSVLYALDGRLLDGTGVWAKPLKFELSLAIHFTTLALIVSRLSAPWRDGNLLWLFAVGAVLCTAFEMAYILLQAGRQQPSHFNISTPVYAGLYALMAIGAVVITASAAVVGVAAILDAEARLGPATRLAVGVGLIAGTILTFVTAFRMGGALDHHVGAELAGARRMPLTGWSLTVGDRRIAHFFATHMMQTVPVAGLAADTLLAPLAATLGVVLFASAWIALTLVLFRQANAGLPVLAWW